MANENVTRRETSPEVRELFRQLLNEHKHNIKIIVLEELIEQCYGAAPLKGRRLVDVMDFKEWLEAKLQDAKEQQAAKEGTPKITLAPPFTKEMLKEEWEAKRKAARKHA
jgi:hypothetical protein